MASLHDMLTAVLIVTQITVTDSKVPLEASMKCYSDGGPHIETFDKWYEAKANKYLQGSQEPNRYTFM